MYTYRLLNNQVENYFFKLLSITSNMYNLAIFLYIESILVYVYI